MIDRDATVDVPSLSLVCDGVSADPAPALRAFYRSSDGTLSVYLDAERQVEVEIYFGAHLSDATYEVGGGDLWCDRAQATGTFSFARSRDVPLTDIWDVEVGTYSSVIDVTFDLYFEESGCELSSGVEPITLVLTNTVTMCAHSRGYH